MLADLLSINIFGVLLIFTRVGTAFTLMPGFSAAYVPQRMRLGLAIAVCFMLAPVLAAELPVMPATVAGLALLVGGEMLIGAFLGTLARIMVSALQTAGTLIALTSAMANALIQDPIAEQQSSTVAGFLVTAGVTLVFVADLHHLMLAALIDSYTLFVPGQAIAHGDFLQVIARRVADSFALGLQMATPFVVVGLVYYIGLGLLGRLMPQLQVFFFGLPIQISVQIWILTLTVSGILLVFLREFAEGYAAFILP